MVARVLFPLLTSWWNTIPSPPTGDHEGPPHRPSSTLAPTDRPASCLTSRLRLMPIGGPINRRCARSIGSYCMDSPQTTHAPRQFLSYHSKRLWGYNSKYRKNALQCPIDTRVDTLLFVEDMGEEISPGSHSVPIIR